MPCSGAPLKASYFLLERDNTSQFLPCVTLRPEPAGTFTAPIESHRPEDGHNTRDEKASDCQQAGRHLTNAGEGGQKPPDEERPGVEEAQGEDEEQGGGEEGQGQEDGRDGEEAGQREGEEQGGEEEGQGEEGEQGDGEKDEEQEKQQEEEDDEEEEDEDFDELTQDEDEEEAMSSASEESLLSIPELQETMKQLAWLASRRRLGADAESEEDHSPTSPGSQEEEEEEEEAPKGGEASGRMATVVSEDDDAANAGEEEAPRGGRRGGGRRGRGPRRARQERHKKDESKASLLYDENMLENDPQRQSKDVAFAQSYLNRVREALLDVPGKMEEFVSLLNDLERLEGQEVVGVFRKLRCILGNRTDLTRDFAAFLHPEQALECGLFQEQQAFERSRRFLRQLEITFGDNPSHYSKIIKVCSGLRTPTAPCAQMATLLKGHPHLQAEFWVFFDELRPPPARPGQFEEAHWPEEGVADGAFEEVTLPDVDEHGHKMDAAMSRRQRRKLRSRVADEESDWVCLCHHSKSRAHRRRGCTRCHGNKVRGVSRAMKSLDLLDTQTGSALEDKDGESKVANCARTGAASWERSFPSADDEEADDGNKVESPPSKRKREEEVHPPSLASSCIAPVPQELPVCAKNISVTPSGEKVILWTREADRVILTTCRQEGANHNTFQGISSLLGNKTPGEVIGRCNALSEACQAAVSQSLTFLLWFCCRFLGAFGI
uniref:Uncharacterized protein n=1 Tax=Hippocampus comes TaxID=109280 RepID=A0A3Q2XX14_HIPCM